MCILTYNAVVKMKIGTSIDLNSINIHVEAEAGNLAPFPELLYYEQ